MFTDLQQKSPEKLCQKQSVTRRHERLGSSGLTVEMIKAAVGKFVDYLVSLFNEIVDGGVIPKEWHLSDINFLKEEMLYREETTEALNYNHSSRRLLNTCSTSLLENKFQLVRCSWGSCLIEVPQVPSVPR